MDGFAGSLLGAIVTIAVPVFGHFYARRIAISTPPTAPLPQVASAITRVLNAFEISEARRFTVKHNHAYSHPHVDLQVGFGSCPRGDGFFAPEERYINLVLPGMTQPERHTKLEAGWTRVFPHEGFTHRLTLVSCSNMDLTFELRVTR
jgi:hypothetical protein